MLKKHAHYSESSQGETEKEHEAEQGSVLPLIVGLCLVLLLIASTVTGVSSVYLERARLQALADQAATSAAQRIEGITAVGASQAQVRLTNAGVQASAQTFLHESGAGADFSHLALNRATGAPEHHTATVVLSARAHPPLLSIVLPDGIDITVTGKARVITTQQ
ncbi:Tad domain-containing protein [Rothia sp. 32237D007AR]